MTDRVAEAVLLARELIIFCDGVEAANPEMRQYARRGRLVAMDAIWLAERLVIEEATVRSMTEQRDAARLHAHRLSAKYHLGDADLAAV